LLLGSSHIGMLNASHIQLIINEKYPDHFVYNLAQSSDKPSKRIHELEQIISLNPKIILYGIGFRDFSSEYFIPTILPDPKQLTKIYFSENSPDFLENPKLVTLNVIKNTLGYNNQLQNLEKNTPFFPYNSEYNQVTDLNELEKKSNSNLSITISNVEKNKDFIALQKIFSTLSKNSVSVLLLTPHNSYYFDSILTHDKENFFKIINNIESNKNIQIHSLMHNYSNNNIWTSENHVTHSSTGIQYNNDVAEIILNILET